MPYGFNVYLVVLAFIYLAPELLGCLVAGLLARISAHALGRGGREGLGKNWLEGELISHAPGAQSVWLPVTYTVPELP